MLLGLKGYVVGVVLIRDRVSKDFLRKVSQNDFPRFRSNL